MELQRWRRSTMLWPGLAAGGDGYITDFNYAERKRPIADDGMVTEGNNRSGVDGGKRRQEVIVER